MPFHAKISELGDITFPTMQTAARWKAWKEGHVGKEIEISERKPVVSDEMRGYVFGAVIPFLRRIVPSWAQLSDDQVYEILKKNFNYFEAYNPVTKRNERYGQSTLSRSTTKKEAQQFIQEIEAWVAENYAMQLPDPEKYKRWKDSAPTTDESYNLD